MPLLSSLRRSKSHNLKEWKLSLDYEKTLAKYVADGTLETSCSVSQLELRAILDSPIAIRYLLVNIDGPLCRDLLNAWDDSVECSKVTSNHEEVLEALISRLSGDLLAALLKEHERHLSSAALDESLLAVVQTLQFARRLCFNDLHERVYAPFRLTPAFASLHRLICDPNSWVAPSSFTYHEVIGEGAFGLVALCSKRSTSIMYAMKIQSKNKLLRHFRKDKRRVMTEMYAHSLCNHPYVVKLAYAMQTKSLAILVLPVAACGDLSRSLTFMDDGRFPLPRVQFYAAEIVSALSYLHDIGIIYRDLKPSNVLLNADGHVMLADFGSVADVGGVLRNPGKLTDRTISSGLSGSALYSAEVSLSASDSHIWSTQSKVHVQRNSSACQHSPTLDSCAPGSAKRTLSLVGTMEYMAPEIIVMFGKKVAHKDGYTAAVDWWSLGILIYKLLVGAEPFNRVPYETVEMSMPNLLTNCNCSFEQIFVAVFGKINYNLPQLNPEAVDLLQRLLAFDPERRVSAASPDTIVNYCKVRSHSFFSGIDWAALEEKRIAPPYVPIAEIAVSGTAEKGMVGMNFVELLHAAARLNLVNNVDEEEIFSPSLGLLGSMLHAFNAVTGSRREHTQRSVSESVKPKNVPDSDQKYFYGWNYVSGELAEEPQPLSWSASLRSLLRKVVSVIGIPVHARVEPT